MVLFAQKRIKHRHRASPVTRNAQRQRITPDKLIVAPTRHRERIISLRTFGITTQIIRKAPVTRHARFGHSGRHCLGKQPQRIVGPLDHDQR